jgi:hypothetical protein
MDYQLESRVAVRDGLKALGLTSPEIIWPEQVSEPDLRLILARENYLRFGSMGKPRDVGTMLPMEALWTKWFRDRVVGSRVRIGLVRGGANSPDLLIVGFSDTFDLATSAVTITL